MQVFDFIFKLRNLRFDFHLIAILVNIIEKVLDGVILSLSVNLDLLGVIVCLLALDVLQIGIFGFLHGGIEGGLDGGHFRKHGCYFGIVIIDSVKRLLGVFYLGFIDRILCLGIFDCLRQRFAPFVVHGLEIRGVNARGKVSPGRIDPSPNIPFIDAVLGSRIKLRIRIFLDGPIKNNNFFTLAINNIAFMGASLRIVLEVKTG